MLSICNDAHGNNIVPIALESGLNQSDYSFVWTLNNKPLSQNSSSIVATAAGRYELIATPNSVDCPQIFSFNVVSLTPIVATYAVSNDFEINQTITVTASGGSGQYEYSFNSQPFQNYPVFSVADGGEIVVKTRDSNGCYEISEVISLWQYPRFFTPNNDSFNDIWGINTSKKINVNIFDRYGKLIKNLTASERWNGTFNSQPLPADDYWFVLNYEGGKVFRGHFSLKR